MLTVTSRIRQLLDIGIEIPLSDEDATIIQYERQPLQFVHKDLEPLFNPLNPFDEDDPYFEDIDDYALESGNIKYYNL
jgi:hypothetical protein